MADTTPNPFQDALNDYITTAQAKQKPQKRTTSAVGLLTDTAGEYPRASLTTAGVGTAVYKGVKGWKQAYKEGLDVMRSRVAAEGKAVTELAGKGVQAIPRFEGTNAAVRTAAKEYAVEKILSGFPFKNQEAINRVADLKTGRVILTGESVVGVRPTINLANNPTTITVTPYMTPQAVAQTPRQVTLETAGKIPKFDLKPSTYVREAGVPRVDLDSVNWTAKTQPNRVTSAPAYTPPSGTRPTIPKRIAQLSTGGVLGKTNVGLEAAAGLYDIVREEGPVRAAYRSAADQGEVAEGVALGTLAAASRAGRSATNMLTMGAPEFLGVYDTLDLLGVENEARRRYMTLRGTQGYPAMNYPVIQQGKEYVPVEDSPYLQMLEAQVAAERGIEKSLMTQGFYRGPEYNYAVQNGKVVAMMKPEYAALYDAESERRIVNMNRNKNVLNIDPTLGQIGYSSYRPEAFNFGNYVDYMADR